MTSSTSSKRAPFIVIEGLDRSGKTTQISLLHARLLVQGLNTRLMKFPDRTTSIGKMIDSYLKSSTELDDKAIHLLFSANRWEMKSTIESLLLSGTPILCDRYAFSGIAFSTAKSLPSPYPIASPPHSPRSPHSPYSSPPSQYPQTPSQYPPPPQPNSLSYEWCQSPDIGLPAPDLTIFLDIDPEKARSRAGYGEERYEDVDLQRRVRSVFRRIAREMGEGTSPRYEGSQGGYGADVSSWRGERRGSGSSQGSQPYAPETRWVTLDASKGIDVVAREIWKLVEPLIRDGVDGPVGRLWEERMGRI